MPCAFRCARDLPDIAPGLLVVRDHELVDAGRDDIALDAGRVGEEHEGLLPLRRRGRIGHGLRRAIVVVDLDEITLLQPELGHIGRVELDEGIGLAIHDEVVLLVKIGVLPDQVGAPVIDQEGELVLLGLLARCLEPAPLRLHKGCLAVLAAELAVGKEPFVPMAFKRA